MKRFQKARESLQTKRAQCWDKIQRTKVSRFILRADRFLDGHRLLLHSILILVYRFSLDFIYLTELSPAYAYSGFTTDVNPFYYGCSVLVLLCFLPFIAGLISQERRPSSILVTMLNYLYFIPLTSYMGCKRVDLTFAAWAALYWALLLFWQYRLPSFQLKTLKLHQTKWLFKLLTIFAVCLVLFVSGKYTGFRLTLDFINVYGIRGEARMYAIPTILSYALSAMTIVLSVLILFWARERKRFIVAALFIVYLLYFSIGAHKSVFLFLILLLGCYVLYRQWMLRWLPVVLTAGVGGCWLASAAGMIYPMSILVRRLMFVPVQLSETYFTYFQNSPNSLFRNGLMDKLSFDSIYSANIVHIIGETLGEPEMSANNGLLGDMFANLPAQFGVLLMPLILAICFRLLDFVTKGIPQKITICFCVFFAISFMNSSWSTVLLSHGYLLACVLLYLFPRKETELADATC